MNAIEMSHVKKRLGDFSIQDLSFALPSGAICGLVGENGAGKSTTIRLLLGGITPDSGAIRLLGTDSTDDAFLSVKEEVGVVLDDACFPETINASQLGNVMQRTYPRWDAAQYAAFLERFELPAKKPISKFSRGMRMKLSLSAALSHHARLLLLDEATAGLDPIVRDEILDLLLEFARDEGHTVLLSSHILSDLEKVCDYIAFLSHGRLLLYEDKDQLLETYALFTGTAEQADSLMEEAVVGRENQPYGGVRCLVRRDMVPPTLDLQRPTVEDVILFLVKGAKDTCAR